MMESLNDGIVEKVVCILNSMKEAKRIITLKQKYEHLHYTIGVHLHSAKDFKQTDIDFIRSHKS